MNLEETLKSVPTNPGCYIYKDINHKVIYVGKAKNLKKRVAQYFSQSVSHSPRIEQMITKIHEMEYHITDTELEALVLEANLIKKYRPKYNVLMKDDKSYTWLKVTIKDEYPKLVRVRDQDKRDDGNLYFGPYPDASSITNIMKLLRHLFPFRTCDYEIHENEEIKKSRLCLYYHIGLCPGPCDHLIDRLAYRKQINQILKFLRGENTEIIDEYKSMMHEYAARQDFEKAAIIRDRIRDMEYVTQKITIGTNVDENILRKQRENIIANAQSELFSAVNVKPSKSYRMECYDISNIQGTNPVGAMVVFEKGIAKKSDYRKFKIRSMNTPNDFAMMREMLTRRLTRLKNTEEKDSSFSSRPDLLIIDGGKGQLGIAVEVLQELGLNIPVVGLAKREELIFFPGNPVPLKLKRSSAALYLIQRIRDEAHRFGITFHRSLRSKAALRTEFDNIPGIGEITKKKLLSKFMTYSEAVNASDEELLTIIDKKALAAIRAYQNRS